MHVLFFSSTNSNQWEGAVGAEGHAGFRFRAVHWSTTTFRDPAAFVSETNLIR